MTIDVNELVQRFPAEESFLKYVPIIKDVTDKNGIIGITDGIIFGEEVLSSAK